MQTRGTEAIVSKAIYLTDKYQELIEIIQSNSDHEGTCRLSPKVLANFLNVESSHISSWLPKLVTLGYLKVEGASYRINPIDAEQSPLLKIAELMQVLAENRELNFGQQAEALQVSMNELEAIYGCFVLLITD
jgi:hypothetical protein